MYHAIGRALVLPKQLFGYHPSRVAPPTQEFVPSATLHLLFVKDTMGSLTSTDSTDEIPSPSEGQHTLVNQPTCETPG